MLRTRPTLYGVGVPLLDSRQEVAPPYPLPLPPPYLPPRTAAP